MEDGGWMMDDGGMEHPQTEDGMEDGGWRVEDGDNSGGLADPDPAPAQIPSRRPCLGQAAAAAGPRREAVAAAHTAPCRRRRQRRT